MDQPDSARPDSGARITLTPDMRPVGAGERDSAAAPSEPAEKPVRPQRPPRAPQGPILLATIGLVLGLAATGIAAWTYMDGQREILRLSTELAQLRVSLDLYARNGAGSSTALADLAERLDSLEQNWRGAAVPLPETASAEEAAAPAQPSPGGEDCLPPGMRLLVAAGDNYPICGENASVEVGVVDNGYIALADGTTVPSGATMPLPDSACTIGVTSDGDEGLTGYAEIRVSC